MHTSTTFNYNKQFTTSHGLLLATKLLHSGPSVLCQGGSVLKTTNTSGQKRFDWEASFFATLENCTSFPQPPNTSTTNGCISHPHSAQRTWFLECLSCSPKINQRHDLYYDYYLPVDNNIMWMNNYIFKKSKMELIELSNH